MIRIFFSILFLTAITLLMVACDEEGTAVENQEEVNMETETDSEFDLDSLDNIYLNLGATSQSSATYSFLVAVANSVSEATDGKIDSTVVETGGSVDNLVRLQEGSIDFGMGTETMNIEAVNGLGDWEENPMPELRSFYIWDNIALPYVVTKESGIETVYDLEGETFFPGITGSATERTTLNVMELLGIEPDYFPGSLEDGTNAVRDRRAMGLVKTGVGTTPDPSIIEIDTTLPMHLLNFDEEEREMIESELDLSFMTIPAGSYPNQEEDVETVIVSQVIFTTTDLPEEVAYFITKGSIENKQMHEDAFAAIKEIDYIDDTIEYASTPLHAGAIKYFEEIGVDVPDHLIPPEVQ